MFKLQIFLFLTLHSTIIFAAVADGRWHPGIGDPTVSGWLTVLIYLGSVVRCAQKSIDSRKIGGNYQFWIYLTIFLLLLGINKQLDLQSWFTQTMRDSAHAHGWYEHRRPLQLGFIVFLAIALLVTLLSLRVFLESSWRQNKLTWIGIILLCAFILMRAASFHHFDIFIGSPILGVRTNVVLEIGAILMIILGTFNENKKVALIEDSHKTASEVVEINEEGETIACPKCFKRPISEAKDGRVFKCKSCGHRYIVRLINA